MFESLQDRYARYRIRYPIYFYHHIPKCGGTSVRLALENWFHVNDDYAEDDGQSNSPPIDLAQLISHNCVSGHFGHESFFIDQRYPEIFKGFRASRRYRVFMFLRDPLEMRCSLYRHELQAGEPLYPDLATAIMSFNNYYARIIGVNRVNWRKRLDQYFFVGNSDCLQQSFDLLAQQIGKPRIKLSISNTTTREGASSSESLTPRQVETFKAENRLDYQIFDYVKQRQERLSHKLRRSS